jgi:hypothetical protein
MEITTMRTTTALLLDLENLLHVADRDSAPAAHLPSGRLYGEHADTGVADIEVGLSPDEAASSWATPAEADAIITWALSQARPHQPSFVLGACAASLLGRYLGECDFPTWLPLRVVADHVPDAADDFLLAEATHLRQRGYAHFVIGSGDGAFAELSEGPDVTSTVLVHHAKALSRRLELASTDICVYLAPTELTIAHAGPVTPAASNCSAAA